MKHLLLLRHAKSSWSNPGLSDFDRPLNDRGHQAAHVMAQYLTQALPRPDQIYCSSAQRTRETLGYLLPVYSHPFEVSIRRELYLASDDFMLKTVQQTAKDVECVMMVAHNPGTEDLALSLAKNTNGEAFVTMMGKYPTAACAHLSFDVSSWDQVAKSSGVLNMFIRPRDLIKGQGDDAH